MNDPCMAFTLQSPSVRWLYVHSRYFLYCVVLFHSAVPAKSERSYIYKNRKKGRKRNIAAPPPQSRSIQTSFLNDPFTPLIKKYALVQKRWTVKVGNEWAAAVAMRYSITTDHAVLAMWKVTCQNSLKGYEQKMPSCWHPRQKRAWNDLFFFAWNDEKKNGNHEIDISKVIWYTGIWNEPWKNW